MSDLNAIIITASVDINIINRLLLSVRSYPWSEAYGDFFTILRTIDPDKKINENEEELPIDRPPLRSLPINEWVGLSIDEVERLMMAKEDGGGSTAMFFVLDDQGVHDHTIILADRVTNDNDQDPAECHDEHNKVRVPWCDMESVWVDLHEANAGFHDYTAEQSDEDEDEDESEGSSRRW